MTFHTELCDKIEKAIKIYNQNGKRAAKDLIDDRSVKHIRGDIKTCLEYGDEKVALAVQTYELVCIFSISLIFRANIGPKNSKIKYLHVESFFRLFH